MEGVAELAAQVQRRRLNVPADDQPAEAVDIGVLVLARPDDPAPRRDAPLFAGEIAGHVGRRQPAVGVEGGSRERIGEVVVRPFPHDQPVQHDHVRQRIPAIDARAPARRVERAVRGRQVVVSALVVDDQPEHPPVADPPVEADRSAEQVAVAAGHHVVAITVAHIEIDPDVPGWRQGRRRGGRARHLARSLSVEGEPRLVDRVSAPLRREGHRIRHRKRLRQHRHQALADDGIDARGQDPAGLLQDRAREIAVASAQERRRRRHVRRRGLRIGGLGGEQDERGRHATQGDPFERSTRSLERVLQGLLIPRGRDPWSLNTSRRPRWQRRRTLDECARPTVLPCRLTWRHRKKPARTARSGPHWHLRLYRHSLSPGGA